MKIKFLGTSYGAPSKDRHQQSFLIEENEDLYIFDTGAPVLDILIKCGYDLSKIRAVFISHIHGDHLNGIFDMLNLSDYFNMNFTVYVSEQMVADLLKSYCELQGCALKNGRVRFLLIDEGEFYSDRLLKVFAFKTKHIKNGEIASFGFLIENSDVKICITGDLNSSLIDFPEFLYSRQTDLVITECAHFSPESLFDKLLRCRADSFAIVHVMPSSQYAQLKTIAENSPLKIYFPKDKDEIELKN
ncbi:MAG: ribonuclease Z [Ruminococcaceae bacterium]|nr:ribonuclease Z [Oscillospiraceae bacterium]